MTYTSLNIHQREIELEVICICPPIPLRRFDYQCTEVDYDEGGVVGYGETEEQAIQDFIEWYAHHHDLDETEIKYTVKP